MRLNVASGALEKVLLPPPLADEPYYFFAEGMVSARDGDVTGASRTIGSTWPETFVLDASSQAVTLHRDSNGLMNDNRHLWSPDGAVIALVRRPAAAGVAILAVLDPATGVIDTIMPAPQPGGISSFFWVGSDTLVYYAAVNGPEFPYRSVTRATKESATWAVVPFGDFVSPSFSADRRWVASWRAEDSTVVGEGVAQFTRLRLVDRASGENRVLREGRTGTTGNLSRAFDPSSRYLAYCRDAQTLVVRGLIEQQDIRELKLPYCHALSWSWGPEGPPASR